MDDHKLKQDVGVGANMFWLVDLTKGGCCYHLTDEKQKHNNTFDLFNTLMFKCEKRCSLYLLIYSQILRTFLPSLLSLQHVKWVISKAEHGRWF